MNTQTIELDISKESQGTQIVRIGQGDSSGTTIKATVYDNGDVPTLTGMTAKMHMRLPDGKSYAEGGSCSISGNVITCVVDESRFAVVNGYTDEAYFSLKSGTTVYSTSRFRVKVERAASKDADPAGMYTDDVEKATKAARDAADAANEAAKQIGTAVEDAQEAAETAAQAVTDAQAAIQDADTAKQSATAAANQATAAANLANQATTNANAATVKADAATASANDATSRAESAIDAMGDISEQAVPLMSTDIRGGAKLGRGLMVEKEALSVDMVGESDGSESGPIASLEAKGHAEQVGTTGKNLLDPSMVPQSTVIVSGMTRSFHDDQLMTLSGTANNTVNGIIRVYGSANDSVIAGAGTYAFTWLGDDLPAGLRIQIYVVDGDGTPRSYTLAESSKTLTFTTDGTVNNVRFYFYTSLSGTTVDISGYMQLELGSTATDYEPYTGGAPSPSPDYPQEIQVVRGRNLLQLGNVMKTYSGITFESTDKPSIRLSGKATAEIGYGDTNYITTLAAGTYTFSGFKTGMLRLTLYKRVNGTNTAMGHDTGNGFTFTLTESTDVFAYPVVASGVTVDMTIYPQLELGSTPTPYVPYGHVGLDVQGRNLIKYPYRNTHSTHNGITYTVNNDGTVTANGTATALSYIILHYSYSFGSYPQGTYTLSGAPSVSGCSIRMQIDNGSGGSTLMIAQSGKSVTFTTNGEMRLADGNNNLFVCVESGMKLANVVFKPQLELGSTPTEYQPYYHTTTPIPLPPRGWVAGLPDGTADTLYIDGAGKCEWTLPTKEIVLDGSNRAFFSTTAPSGGMGYRHTSNGFTDVAPTSDSAVTNLLITHGTGNLDSLAVNKWKPGDCCIGYGSKHLYLVLPESVGTTYTEANAWLSTHPVTVLYPLATPVTKDMGYVEDWPTDIPDGATVTISELDSVGIKYFIDSSVTELARQWYEKAYAELGDAITELSQRVAALEQ